MGAALTSTQDLSFRNLGGKAVQSLPVDASAGTLRTRVRLTSVARNGDVILLFFDFDVAGAQGHHIFRRRLQRVAPARAAGLGDRCSHPRAAAHAVVR